MISKLLVGIARCLFSLAVVFGITAAILTWASVRILKRAWKDPGITTREAGFEALASLVRLARVAGVRLPSLEEVARDAMRVEE